MSLLMRRCLSTAVKFKAFGNPSNVLKITKDDNLRQLTANEISLKVLVAAINPSDINMVEGTYGHKPTLPSVAGNEGVAVVSQVGENVKDLKVGDWVMPLRTGLGMWRQNIIAARDQVVKIPNDIPPAYAATLAVNPAAAYRILRDFEALKPGDVVLQNGANSMVGLAVVQLAKQLGVKTINIVRSDLPETEKALRLLTNLGGDVNITDSFVNTPSFREILDDLPPCKLAINCIGGDITQDIIRSLAPGGTLVTLGGMSKQSATVPFELIASKQLKLRGFWLDGWYQRHSASEKAGLLSEIAQLVREKKLTFFYEVHDFDDFNYALERALKPEVAVGFRKVLLNIDHPDRLMEHDSKDEKEYQIFETNVV